MTTKVFQAGKTAPKARLGSGAHSPGNRAKQQSTAAKAHANVVAQRRDILLSTAGAALLATAPARAGDTTASATLPPSGKEGFYIFKPDRSRTPALRAGTVDRENPYKFLVPANWSEKKVPNIQSGNYCQPRCAEPWTEVIFGNDSEGKASVIVAPLVRLTNKKDVKIEEIGNPEGLLASLGAFITGTSLEAEEVEKMEQVKQDDGLMYYYYNAYSTAGLSGPHTYTACTVKGDLCLLFSVAANDKQWAKGKQKIDTMVNSFRA